MTTLTEFLLARIAEDEEDARDAYYEGQRWIPEEEAVVAADRDLDPVMFLDRKRDAYHAANWSPARVLAECEAKRRIVEMSTWISNQERRPTDRPGVYDVVNTVAINEDMESVLFALATIYADHPDYDESWRP